MSSVVFPGLGFQVNVKDIAFRVFDWPIHWYGIIIALGFLLAVAFCSRRSKRYGVEQDDIIDLLIYAVPLCIIGARLYYVIFYLDLYRNADGSLDFMRMVRIWDGGLAIYGGIIAAILVLWVFCKKRKLCFLAFADLGSFGMLIGQLVGRWGNFVNVEAYGGPTDLPWRMGIYDDALTGVYQYMEVHPTFLYESLWNLLGLLLLIFLVEKRRKFDGQIFLSYMAWYGLGRSWIEGLRTDSLYFFSTGLRVSQVLAIIIFVAATAVLVFQLCRPHSPEDLWPNRLKARKAAEEVNGGEDREEAWAETPGSAEEIMEELKKEEHSDDPA